MKKIVFLITIISCSLNVKSQMAYGFALSSGVNSISIDDFTFVNIPIKGEFEMVANPGFSFSIYLNYEFSLNSRELMYSKPEKGDVLEIGFVNLNFALLNDLDMGNSIILNIGTGITTNPKFISGYGRFGVTGQKQISKTKFLFANVNYIKPILGDYPRKGYIKNRFELNFGIKFLR